MDGAHIDEYLKNDNYNAIFVSNFHTEFQEPFIKFRVNKIVNFNVLHTADAKLRRRYYLFIYFFQYRATAFYIYAFKDFFSAGYALRRKRNLLHCTALRNRTQSVKCSSYCVRADSTSIYSR